MILPQTHLYHFLEDDLQVLGVRSKAFLVSFKLMHGGREFCQIRVTRSVVIPHAEVRRTVNRLRTLLEGRLFLREEGIIVLPVFGLNEERANKTVSV